MNKQETLSLLFESFASRNVFNLKKRIAELNFPINTLERIEEKGWVSCLNYGKGESEIHYQRESFPTERISKERIIKLENIQNEKA